MKVLFQMDEDNAVHIQRDGLTSLCGTLETNFIVGNGFRLKPTCRRCIELSQTEEPNAAEPEKFHGLAGRDRSDPDPPPRKDG